MDQVLKSHTLPKLKQQETHNLNNPITTIRKFDFAVKNLHKALIPDGFIGKFIPDQKEEIIIQHKLFQKIEKENFEKCSTKAYDNLLLKQWKYGKNNSNQPFQNFDNYPKSENEIKIIYPKQNSEVCDILTWGTSHPHLSSVLW